jgi:hypothetical protein
MTGDTSGSAPRGTALKSELIVTAYSGNHPKNEPDKWQCKDELLHKERYSGRDGVRLMNVARCHYACRIWQKVEDLDPMSARPIR